MWAVHLGMESCGVRTDAANVKKGIATTSSSGEKELPFHWSKIGTEKNLNSDHGVLQTMRLCLSFPEALICSNCFLKK